MTPRPKDLLNLFLEQALESGHLVLTPTDPTTRADLEALHALYLDWSQRTLRKPLTRRQVGATIPWTSLWLHAPNPHGFKLKGFKVRS